MSFQKQLLVGFLFLFIVYIVEIDSFNVDTKYPIIIRSRGDDGVSKSNYFGASVKFLRSDSKESWVIIGAPRANSTLPTYKDILEPGVIWQCSLGRQQEYCRPLVIDPTGNSYTYQANKFNYTESKSNSWLGGPNSIAIDNSNFVACASKWESRRNDDNATMDGVCYHRPRSSLFEEDLNPTINPMRPLVDPVIKAKMFWQNGQAGFSVHLPKTGNEIVMGAPGGERYMGSLIQYLSSGEGTEFKKTFVSDPLLNQNDIQRFNYLGYSLSSGYFYDIQGPAHSNRLEVQYVAGAPRGNNLAGKVLLFQFPSSQKEPLRIIKEFIGDQSGSYFGSAILTLDVNNDGYDDLLISAPRFTRNQNIHKRNLPLSIPRKRSFEKFEGYGDEGAVYLYLSNKVTLSSEKKLLDGGNKPWGQFGTAMCSLGDINRDGFNDFAISAPFESNSGAVYIYHGTKSGVILSHSQVILGKDIDSLLRGFGFSLAGQDDIDKNGFTDLAIGSFHSSQAVILRTKPIITVYGKITSPLNKLPFNLKAFIVESCIQYTGEYSPASIRLKVRLSPDILSRPRPARVQLKSQTVNSVNFVEYDVSAVKDEETCKKFDVNVIEPLESSGAAVVFQQEIFISEEEPSGAKVKPRNMEINSDGSFHITGEDFDSFCKTCPVINSEKPKQFSLSLPLAVECGNDDKCEADLVLSVSFRDVPETGYVIGSSSSMVMDVHLNNSKETAIAPAVLISWRRLKLKRNPQDCDPEPETGNSITFKCTLGKLLEENQSVNISLEFDVSDLILQEGIDPQLVFNVTAITASDIIDTSTSSKVMFVPLTASADLYLTGSKMFESVNLDTKAPFLVFKQTFEISQEGPTPVANIWVVFSLPVNITTASGQVINVRGVISNQNMDEMVCIPTKGTFEKSSSSTAEVAVSEDDYPDFDAAGIGGILPADKDISRETNSSLVDNSKLQIHCDSPFISCMEVTCKTPRFSSTHKSSITFIMDIESNVIKNLLKVYKVSAIQLESKGALVLPEIVKKIQPEFANQPEEAISITLIEKEGYRKVSKWIYILAVVIGLLVLACVVFCLYSCGCFEKEKSPGVDSTDAVDSPEEKVPLQGNIPEEEENENRTQPQDIQLRASSHSMNTPPTFIPPEHPPITNEENGEGKLNKSFNRHSNN